MITTLAVGPADVCFLALSQGRLLRREAEADPDRQVVHSVVVQGRARPLIARSERAAEACSLGGDCQV